MADEARRSLEADDRGRGLRSVDRARLDRGLAARHGLGLRDPRGRRDLLRAAGDQAGRARERQGGRAGGLGQAEAAAGDLGRRRLHRDEDPRAERPVRDRDRGRTSGIPRPGKTGTTEEHSDAWFAGYTPRLQTTVWIGYPRGKVPMTNVHGISVSGGSFPAQIWRLFMSSAIGQLEPLEFPEPTDYPEWVSFERGTIGRSFGYTGPSDYGDDSEDAETEPAETDESSEPEPEPATTATSHPGANPDRGADHRGASTRTRRRRRRLHQRPPSRRPRSSPDGSLPPRRLCGRSSRARSSRTRTTGELSALILGCLVLVLLAGCVVAAWLGRRSARSGGRRPRRGGRRDAGSGSSSPASRAPLPSISIALVLLRRARAAARRGRSGGRGDPAPAARRAAPALDRRLDVLAVRRDRGRGGNPYRDAPSDFPGNPAYEHAGFAWRDTTSVYGPAFTLGSELVARAVGSSRDAAAWTFKVLAALGMLALTGLAAVLARERARRCGARRLEPALRDPLRRRRPQRLGDDGARARGARARRLGRARPRREPPGRSRSSSSGSRSSSSLCGRSRRGRPGAA